jgi:hypothetical protein
VPWQCSCLPLTKNCTSLDDDLSQASTSSSTTYICYDLNLQRCMGALGARAWRARDRPRRAGCCDGAMAPCDPLTSSSLQARARSGTFELTTIHAFTNLPSLGPKHPTRAPQNELHRTSQHCSHQCFRCAGVCLALRQAADGFLTLM